MCELSQILIFFNLIKRGIVPIFTERQKLCFLRHRQHIFGKKKGPGSLSLLELSIFLSFYISFQVISQFRLISRRNSLINPIYLYISFYLSIYLSVQLSIFPGYKPVEIKPSEIHHHQSYISLYIFLPIYLSICLAIYISRL